MRKSRQLLALSLCLGSTHSAIADERLVRRDWLTDVHVTQGVREGDPVFLEGRTWRCENAILGPPEVSIGVDGPVRVVLPIEVAPVCSGHNLPTKHAILIGSMPQGRRALLVIGRDADHPDTAFVLPDALPDDGREGLSVDVSPSNGLRAFHSGLWSVPERPGEGVSLTVLEAGAVFAYFGADSKGIPLWVVSEVIPDGATTGELFVVDGGRFDAPSATTRVWGRIRYAFPSGIPPAGDCGGLQIELIRNQTVVKTMALSRLAAARSQPSCRFTE